jgi:hypothetical protein
LHNLSSLSSSFRFYFSVQSSYFLNLIEQFVCTARHYSSTNHLQKAVKNALKIKSNNERGTILKHSKKPELSDKRAVKTLIFRQFGLLKSTNKRQATDAG